MSRRFAVRKLAEKLRWKGVERKGTKPEELEVKWSNAEGAKGGG